MLAPFVGSGRCFDATGVPAAIRFIKRRELICSLGGQFYTDLIAKGAHVCFDRNACSKRPAL
jgi:hypothetical protein